MWYNIKLTTKISKYLSHTIYVMLLYFKKDPCDEANCNGSNAVCQVVYSTGKPFCTCPQGFKGDPKIRCGKNFTIWRIHSHYFHYLNISIEMLLFYFFSIIDDLKWISCIFIDKYHTQQLQKKIRVSMAT